MKTIDIITMLFLPAKSTFPRSPCIKVVGLGRVCKAQFGHELRPIVKDWFGGRQFGR
jgi:hypothetical protein